MAPLIFLAHDVDIQIVAQIIRINVSFFFIRQKYIFNGYGLLVIGYWLLKVRRLEG